MDNNTEYCFTITALNEGGESEHSNEVCETTSNVDIKELKTLLNIYPNCVDDKLMIETNTSIKEISIYNVHGVMVYNTINLNANYIDVSNFNAGHYIVNFRIDNGNVIKRFTKN